MKIETYMATSDGWRSLLKKQAVTPPDPDPVDDAILPYWGAPTLRQDFPAGQPIDENIWYLDRSGGLGNDSGYLMRENLQIGPNGGLHLIAKKLNTPINSGGRTRYVSSSSTWTQNKWSQRGGRFEAKIRMNWPHGRAPKAWPGWWTRAVGASGEPDIMETIAGPHTKENVHAHGVPSYTVHESTNHEAGTTKIEHKEPTVDVCDGQWHTFTMDWYIPEKHNNPRFEFRRNGVLRWTTTYAQYPWLASSHPGDIYLRLDLQTGGEWHGYVTAADAEAYANPVIMEVAHVRVWQHPDV